MTGAFDHLPEIDEADRTRRTTVDPDAVSDVDDADGDEARLLTRLNRRGFRLVQLADAAIVLLVPVISMIVISRGFTWPTYPRFQYAWSFLLVAAIFGASLYFGGLYEREPRLGHPSALPRAGRQTIAAGGTVALINLAVSGALEGMGRLGDGRRALALPTSVLIATIILTALGVAAGRRVANWVRVQREGPPRIVLVGAPDDIEVAASHIGDDVDRAVVVATTTNVEHLISMVEHTRATDVVLLSSAWLDELYPHTLLALEDRDVTVLQRVTAKETMFGLQRIREVGGLPFVLLRSQTMPVSRARFKRFTDLFFLLALLPMFLPATLFVAGYCKFVAGGPVLFWQTRVGAQGKHFRMVKFRTMRQNAEEDGNPQLATHDDPRIIPACRWLRASRMDELPQLWNIVRGEMSLVGPRPERPELTAGFAQVIAGYERRHELAPGLTGLAQIHGRYETDPEYKLGYDLQYLVNWSPVLDLEILAKTAWVVATRRV